MEISKNKLIRKLGIEISKELLKIDGIEKNNIHNAYPARVSSLRYKNLIWNIVVGYHDHSVYLCCAGKHSEYILATEKIESYLKAHNPWPHNHEITTVYQPLAEPNAIEQIAAEFFKAMESYINGLVISPWRL